MIANKLMMVSGIIIIRDFMIANKFMIVHDLIVISDFMIVNLLVIVNYRTPDGDFMIVSDLMIADNLMISIVSVRFLTVDVVPSLLNLFSGRLLSSELELKVQLKLSSSSGLAETLQLMEAISPWATPYTNFWCSEQTGLTAERKRAFTFFFARSCF